MTTTQDLYATPDLEARYGLVGKGHIVRSILDSLPQTGRAGRNRVLPASALPDFEAALERRGLLEPAGAAKGGVIVL